MRKIRKAFKLFFESIGAFLFVPFNYLPGYAGNKIRYFYYKRKLRYLGKVAIIDVGVQFVCPEFISIGDNTLIDKYVILEAGPPWEGERVIIRKKNPDYKGKEGELIIGRNCHIAPYSLICAHGGVDIGENITVASGAKIYSLSHHYRNPSAPMNTVTYKFSSRAPQKEQCVISAPVVMHNNTALGLNSVMLPGVTIGKNSWVGVNSTVNSNIPPNVIAIGYPAKVIKERFPKGEEDSLVP